MVEKLLLQFKTAKSCKCVLKFDTKDNYHLSLLRIYLSSHSERKRIREIDITGNLKMRNLKMNIDHYIS